MKKLFLFSLAALLLMGAGCSTVPADHGQDSYYYDDYDTTYDDAGYDDAYDSYDSYDSYDDYDAYGSSVPQGYQDVYACDLDAGNCLYVEANISGSEVSSVYTSYYIYPSESLCDTEGCYFVDDMYHEWYFSF
jgi:hypothetical protein